METTVQIYLFQLYSIAFDKSILLYYFIILNINKIINNINKIIHLATLFVVNLHCITYVVSFKL